jgi:hypothetical protein
MLLLQSAAILIGAIAVLLVLQDVFEVLLLPRRVLRNRRLSSLILRPTWRLWRRAANQLGTRRAAFLSCYGPLSVVILFFTWAVCLIVAYGLCQWGINLHTPQPLSLDGSLYLSGSTFFTLGFGDVTPHSGAAKILAVVEAANGFGLVAAVIGYLPVLYQSFSNRETHVIQLDARAGSPPSAAFLLNQHGGADAMPELMDYLRHCENWAATLIEGNLSFPMLAFYRSHHDNQSWLAALCAIMDCCAVLLTGLEGVNAFQPRMTFALGRMAILELTNTLRLTPEDPKEDRLSPQGYDYLTSMLRASNLNWAEADAETRLALLRTTYEPLFYAISQYLALPLPEWFPSAAPDNWQSGEDGEVVKELIDTTPPAAQAGLA